MIVRAPYIVIIAVLWLAPCRARALEPCSAGAERAVRSGALVFLGRIVKAEEVERRRPYHSVIVATVIPYVCLKGFACKAGRSVRVRYLFADQERLEANFAVGAQYLFAFRQATRGPEVLFDTDFRSNCTDMAYAIRSDVSDWVEPAEARMLTNLWRRDLSEKATLRDIRSWASAR